jgi:PAS domain S-box-containing protein
MDQTNTSNDSDALRQRNSALEKELLTTKDFLHDILHTSSAVSIISTDLDRNIVFWNSGAERIFGYSAEEMVNKSKIDRLYPTDDDSSRQAIEHARDFVMTHKKGATCDVPEKTKDGKEIWVKLNMTPRFNEKGEIIGMLGMGQEITHLKQTEKKLSHSLKKLRRAIGGTIHAVALTVEKRDPYTAGHQRRATDLARAIGDELQLPKDVIDGIRMAGVIHDMGKIYVPAEILNKPGRLTKNEFTLIKCHPEAGFDIIKYIDFPWPIGQIVLQHHERMNGSGYPNGLEADQICIEAKIIAVADVVESMSSHRPYRPALGIDAALEEIIKNRGVLYDKDVVDACLRLVREKHYQFKARDDSVFA